MKIRTDFVTNSSSSSFILARKGSRLTPAQREAIADYVEARLLGDPVTEASFKSFCDENYLEEGDSDYEDVLSLLKTGWTPLYGRVGFEDTEYTIQEFLHGLWTAVQKAGPDTFRKVNTDLSY